MAVECEEDVTYETLRTLALSKIRLFFPHLLPDGADDRYKLMYKGGTPVDPIPGTQESFTLKRFKEALGLSWGRLSFGLYYSKCGLS